MKVISVLNKIYEKAGGMTRVSMHRTESFAGIGIDSAVATLEIDNNLNDKINNLISISTISSKLKVINFYSSLSYAHKYRIELSEVFSIHHQKSLMEKVKRITITPRDSNSTLIKYFTSSNDLFLEEYLNEDNVCTCVLYYHPHKGCLQFSSKNSIHAHWLSELKGTSDCYYLADTMVAAKSVCMISDKNAYKILMTHSNHLLPPWTIGSKLAPKYKDVFDYNKLSDAFVTLTAHQREDIKSQFDINIDNFYVIPNPTKTVNNEQLVGKSKDLVIILSRLTKVKQIDKIIKAFSHIVSSNKNAILEIWGNGVERDNLETLVKKSKLENNVKFMGFSINPHRELSRATVALSMSLTEGFPGSMVESLACGTPVVSTKTKYGPTDIITDGKDGFLVNNEKEFIEKVSYLLNNPDIAYEMGKKGITSSSRFMANEIVNKWISLFDELKKNRAHESKYDFQGKLISNTGGSKLGWVYLDKDEQKVASLEKSGSIFIRTVDKNKNFGGICELDSQVYDIEKVNFDTKKEVYRFRVIYKGEIYKGSIPAKSIEFVVL